MKRLALLVALAAGAAGCRNSFDPASFVDKLRLLAVQATPPEVAPGAATKLQAFWANPGGSAPAIRWDACLVAPPPATGRAVNPDCFGLDGGSPLEPLGEGETLATTMPMVTPEMLGLPDASNGFYVQLRVQLDADGNTLLGFYGLRVSLGALSPNPANKNPELTGIFTVPSADAGAADQTALDEAAPPEVHANDKIDLRALVTPESSESYVVYDGDPRTTPPRTATETVRISWFTTAGTFDNDVTGVAKPDTTLTLDKHLPASDTPIDLWVVARDERGGIDVKHATLLFR
ncbi:MAG: hypothetical protein ACXVDD_24870 [Polyangia bacterium]